MNLLITGGGGSLGVNLIKLVGNLPEKITVVSRDEAKLAKLPKDIDTRICDVRNLESLTRIFNQVKPTHVIHAAAKKRLDTAESNVEDYTTTNALGSINVCKASVSSGAVQKCILISTDKACQAVGTYACSKLIAERAFVEYNHYYPHIRFGGCRYANVIASKGSVINLWANNIKEGKTVYLTDDRMTRFFFTLKDASKFVFSSLQKLHSGEIYIPKMFSFRMVDIIKALENILDRKAKVEVIGLRPAEKTHEKMICETELPQTRIVDENTFCLAPQLDPQPIYKRKYSGGELSSETSVCEDIKYIENLLVRGLDCIILD